MVDISKSIKTLTTTITGGIMAIGAVPANATAFDVTYTGTVLNDQYGDFLANDQSATGDPFSLTFEVNTATPGASSYVNAIIGEQQISGTYASDPVQVATIAIAGQRFSTPANSSTYLGNGFYDQTVSYPQYIPNYYANTNYNYQEAYQYSGTSTTLSIAGIIIENQNGIINAPYVFGGSGAYQIKPGETASGSYTIADRTTGNIEHNLQLNPTAVFFSAVGSVANLTGGSQSSPAKLSITGPVSVIDSTVPSGESEEFYEFHWNGGYFSSEVSVEFPQNYPSNESIYRVELIRPGFGSIPVLNGSLSEPAADLYEGDNFTSGVSAAGSPSTGYYDFCNGSYPPGGGCGLAAGNYEIGIVGDTSIDPMLTISFASPVFAPVTGVPEPATWALMLAGFGVVGSAMRRRKIATSFNYA